MCGGVLALAAPSLAVDQAVGLRFMSIAATSEFAATSATAVTYSFFPEPWEVVLEFQPVQTTVVGGAGRQLHNGPLSWTGFVVAPRYRFSPFSGPLLKRLTPLMGVGLGFYIMDHSLSGQGKTALVIDCSKELPNCAEPQEKLTSTVGVHADAGLDLALFWGWSVSVEGRWMTITPDVITEGTPQNLGADPPAGPRATVSIRRAAQYFTMFNWLLRYRF